MRGCALSNERIGSVTGARILFRTGFGGFYVNRFLCLGLPTGRAEARLSSSSLGSGII